MLPLTTTAPPHRCIHLTLADDVLRGIGPQWFDGEWPGELLSTFLVRHSSR